MPLRWRWVRPAPRRWSLVRRLTGGVALIAVLAFVSQALLLDFWLHPLLDELAAGIAAHALSVQAALGAVPPGQRLALAHRLSTERMQVDERAPPDSDDADGPPGGFAGELALRLGPQMRVRRGLGPFPGFVLGVPVQGQIWWLSFSTAAPRALVLDTVLFWLAVVALLTLSALLLSVRFIARPIGVLAGQIGSQRGALRPIAEDPRASDELRALVRAFNGLVQAVEAGGATRQQLLAGVSHDLRTPLARLRLRAETQCEPPLADLMLADLQSLERIVDQFLAYVQGDRGQRIGRDVPLAAAVAGVVRRYAAQGDPVSAQLADTDQAVPDLPLQRLLGNLIDNALAYGQAPVCVELVADGTGAALRVLDQGLGMSRAEFELAQQPFVRLSPARSELGHCGLGLAIVAQIARQWGGELRLARGNAGFGIEVTIPRRDA